MEYGYLHTMEHLVDSLFRLLYTEQEEKTRSFPRQMKPQQFNTFVD